MRRLLQRVQSSGLNRLSLLAATGIPLPSRTKPVSLGERLEALLYLGAPFAAMAVFGIVWYIVDKFGRN